MADQLPSNPLQAIIAGVARATPAETGRVAAFRRRLDPRPGRPIVILCDTSSSMDDAAGSRRRIEVLREALDRVLPDCPSARIIAFGSTAAEVPSASRLPEPAGGTALHLALDLAAKLDPSQTLVMSDGQPDSESAAMAAADRVAGRIDTIFCGPDSDRAGRDFMARLARAGCGATMHADLARSSSLALGLMVREQLGLPCHPKGSR